MSARAYAEALLRELGCEACERTPFQRLDARSAVARWEASGVLALTGFADGPPVAPTVALPDAADGALAAFAALTPGGKLALRGGAELLGERAAVAGLVRRGRISPGGACRLLHTRDAWLAVNLPRADDARALAAWLEDEALACASSVDESVWRHVSERLVERSADTWVERARWLGLAVARADPPAVSPGTWLRTPVRSGRVPTPRSVPPLVVDLSSLWAGPLSGRLLRLAGARVIKLESTRRPDGARFGPPAFFDLLNRGKECLALDFAAPDGRGALARQIASADIVIESARPRALLQLGIDAAAWVAERPGRVWLSLTGYGRDENGVAFGDDAAAAAGLCWCVSEQAPLFVGDAIADPLAGLHGALAAQTYWSRGEGALLDVSLVGVVAHVIEASAREARAR